jgi:protein involved in polysaccharide export with SLBB domain
MRRQLLAGLLAASMSAVTVICVFSAGVAAPQENAGNEPAPLEKAARKVRGMPALRAIEEAKTGAAIDKMIAAYDLKPHPLPAIPDDPPPHEGAMISLPHIVEPPDLVLVEVLDALPGRPISGERLVKADGTITLGFYGDVHVAGLTLDQVKVAIIKHLRNILSDESLGLLEPAGDEPAASRRMEMPANPELPKQSDNPFDVKEKAKPRSSSLRSPSRSRSVKPKPRVASHRPAGSGISVHPVSRTAPHEQAQKKAAPAAAPAPNQLTVPMNGPGRVTITIQVDGLGPPAAQEKPDLHPLAREEEVRWNPVSPQKSGAVFVDITAYNSKNYYVLGDVQVVGRLPWTGNESVLDALQFAGGFVSSAEAKDIRLVRPARAGKPARVYKVDLAAIEERGDVKSNYQIFPGDRLIVGRNEVIKKTVELDRLAAPLLSITGNMMQEAFALRALQFGTAENREKFLAEHVDFWARELARPGGVKLDEHTLREAFFRRMKLMPASPSIQPPR